MSGTVQLAGLWRRFGAYFFDVLLIVVGVAAVGYAFFGFDETLREYLDAGPDDLDVHVRFLVARSVIRNVSLVIYLVYSAIMDASPLQGTVGKWLLSIGVVDLEGHRLTRTQAAWRNSSKLLSILSIVGLLVALWSPRRQTWHDRWAGTLVIRMPDHRPASPGS